jgi:hypothetical protein
VQVTTISQALEARSTSLVSIKAEHGQDMALDILKVIITDLVDAFNVGKTMSDAQIDNCTLLILEDYWHLKLADFQVFCKEAKKGRYGKLYDFIDSHVIIGWLSIYDQERTAMAQFRNEKAAAEHKKSAAETPILRELTSGEKAMIYERMKNPPVKPLPPLKPNTDPMYAMHQRWIAQFEKLHAENPAPGKGRFIKRFGRHMDINAWLEHKQKQYLNIREN